MPVGAQFLCSFEFPPLGDEGVAEEFGCVGPFQGVLLEAVGEEVADLNRPLLHLELLRHYPLQLLLVLYVERVHPRKQLVSHRPQRPNVDLLVILVSDQDLGGEVKWRPTQGLPQLPLFLRVKIGLSKVAYFREALLTTKNTWMRTMFQGFTSRWMTPLVWRWLRASSRDRFTKDMVSSLSLFFSSKIQKSCPSEPSSMKAQTWALSAKTEQSLITCSWLMKDCIFSYRISSSSCLRNQRGGRLWRACLLKTLSAPTKPVPLCLEQWISYMAKKTVPLFPFPNCLITLKESRFSCFLRCLGFTLSSVSRRSSILHLFSLMCVLLKVISLESRLLRCLGLQTVSERAPSTLFFDIFWYLGEEGFLLQLRGKGQLYLRRGEYSVISMLREGVLGLSLFQNGRVRQFVLIKYRLQAIRKVVSTPFIINEQGRWPSKSNFSSYSIVIY